MSIASRTLATPRFVFRTRRAVPRTRGFSIVELMVAVTLALIVTAAVLSAFLGSRSSFMSTSGTAAVSDNGRFALDFLQSAVRDAGYMACNTTQRQISMLNVGGSPLYFSFGQPLGGYEANNTVSNTFTLAAAPGSATATAVTPDSSLTDWHASTGPAWGGNLDPVLANLVVKNSDVLVVNSTLRSSSPPALVTNIATGASNFTVQNSYNLQSGLLAVISDCAKSVVFQIGGPTLAPNTANANIPFSSGGGQGANSASSFVVSFEVGSEVTLIDTTIYYIGQGADGDAALFSLDLGAHTTFVGIAPTELVPDIENMQILYGVDTTGAQTVSEYVPASSVIDFNTVMSVKIAVLAASQPGAVPKPAANPSYQLLGNTVFVPADTRSRQVFEITASTRNMED
jgi:type IV pilus assembly protein PilW